MEQNKLIEMVKTMAEEKQLQEVKLGEKIDNLKIKKSKLKVEAMALEELASKLESDLTPSKK